MFVPFELAKDMKEMERVFSRDGRYDIHSISFINPTTAFVNYYKLSDAVQANARVGATGGATGGMRVEYTRSASLSKLEDDQVLLRFERQPDARDEFVIDLDHLERWMRQYSTSSFTMKPVGATDNQVMVTFNDQRDAVYFADHLKEVMYCGGVMKAALQRRQPPPPRRDPPREKRDTVLPYRAQLSSSPPPPATAAQERHPWHRQKRQRGDESPPITAL